MSERMTSRFPVLWKFLLESGLGMLRASNGQHCFLAMTCVGLHAHALRRLGACQKSNQKQLQAA